MQLFTDEYKKLNEELHQENDAYGRSGHKYVQTVLQLSDMAASQDVLDYGCGKSTLAQNLPFKIKQYDPAISKYSTLPEPTDIVVCTDVLEHIEPECLDNVLLHLQNLTLKFFFCVIATRPAKKVLKDGRNAHLIQQPYQWWLPKLWDRFEIINFNHHPGEVKVIGLNKTFSQIGQGNVEEQVAAL